LCGNPISRQTTEQILQHVLALRPDDRIMVLAPVVRGRKGEYKKDLEKLARQGFVRARIDGILRALEDDIPLDKRRNHTIEVVVDRLLVKAGIEKRLEASIETATKLAGGLVLIAVVNGEERLYSQKLACTECGTSIPQLEPRSFSFNSPYGACEECTGLGSKWAFDPGKAIVDFSRPLLEGGLGPGAGSAYMRHRLGEAAKAMRIDLGTPFDQFPKKVQTALLDGSNGFPGILKILAQTYDESSEGYREWLTEYMSPGRVSRVSRQAAAARQPGGTGEKLLHRRVHGDAHCARADDGAQLGIQRARDADRRARCRRNPAAPGISFGGGPGLLEPGTVRRHAFRR
jgi:excinuclease ABC subunit A